MNLADTLARLARTRPETPALIDGERSLTFAALDRLVSQTAAHLGGLGVAPGDRVGLCLKDDADHVVALYAVARSGAVFVPVDWRAPLAEKSRVCAAADLSLLLTAADAEAPTGIAAEAVDGPWHEAVARASDRPHSSGGGDSPLSIAATSGTTGTSKLMPFTHNQFLACIAKRIISFGANDDHRYLSVTPLCFAAGWHQLIYLVSGGSTAILHPTLFSADEYVEAANRHRVTFGYMVPTMLRWLLPLSERAQSPLPTLRILLAGSDVLQPEEKVAALRLCPGFHEHYATSATGTISVLRPEDMSRRAESVGHPNILTTVEIVDDDGRALGAGAIGHLRVRGPGVIEGYLDGAHADAPQEDFRDGWFYPGESALRDEAGYLYLKGRVASRIIRGGVTIQAEEIEAVLLSHSAVAEAAVIGRPSKELGQVPVAFVVPAVEPEAEPIFAHCRQHLATAKVPDEIVFVDALPRTAAGKVKRGELAALLDRD